MKRRIFAFLMAMVMLASVVPTQAFAKKGDNGNNGQQSGGGTSGNASNLGWEYADVTPTYDDNGNFAGYDLSEASTHLGQYVTVTYSGDLVNDADEDGKWDEGQTERQDGIISSGSTESVTITCASGCYIEWVVLACGDRSSPDNPFNCQTVATDAGIGWQNTIATFQRITLSMADIYSHANHASNDDAYYLMIELKRLPSTVYVGYNSGTITKADGSTYTVQSIPVDETGDLSDGATQVSTYPTWKYDTTSPTHEVLGISAAAEAEANAQGYSFAGWQLTYYAEYDDTTNTFSGDSAIGATNLFRGRQITLTIHAKLTAIWQPMDTITVTKVWSDANNQDGIRPESVEVHLLRNGVHNGSPATLSAGNNWTHTWNVPSLDENGNAITWTVEESVPSGYTASYSGDAENGFVVTNTHAVELTSTHVQKVWNDDNDRDGIRPHGVKVQLYKNGEAVTSYTDSNGNTVSGSAILTAANAWAHQWLDLEKNQAGAVGLSNTYTVQETGYVDEEGNTVTNPGYTVSESTDAETGLLQITNTHQSATMDIPVEKVWSDSDNRDGKRPGSVTITLTANGVATDKTLVLNDENDWKGTFEDVYVNANGNPIHYSVIENEVAGYTVSITGSAADGFVVTNSHTPETTSVPVTKVWDDGNNQDGIQPGSVEVQLYADGVEVEGKKLTLNAAGNWQGSFGDLPKYRTGKVGELIVYTVKEAAVPGYNVVDGVAQSVTAGIVDGKITITNTHTPEVVKLDVEKVWDDANNQDGIRAHAVVVTLYINGQATDKTLTLNAANGWKASWENLPRFENGQRISYSVVETGHIDLNDQGAEVYTAVVPEGYTVDHDYTGEDTNHHTATVTNFHEPIGTDLNVQKIWDDDDNRAGLRPASITVELYADGEATGKTLTLNPENEWDGTFTDLPVYSGGQKIKYTVVETALDSELGYESPIYSDLDETLRVITVTNKRADEKVSVTVNKKWTDENNQDNIRPESVTVTLYANGIATSTTAVLTEESGWKAEFSNLYKHYNGKEVVYTVVETAVEGYTAEYTKTTDEDGNVTIEVENTHTPEVISIPVTKVWEDENDRDGIRPASVTVKLYADGVEKTKLTLKEENNWQGSFDDLPKYLAGAQGQLIAYTIEETDVRAEYTAEVTGSAADGYTVTNTYVPEKTSIKVNKEWVDENNQDRVRPSSITVYLYANGTLKQEATLEASKGWTYEWTDLYKYEEGKEINYTVYEETLENGYSATIERTDENTIKITNTRNVNKTTFTVQKVWSDANNQDNVRYSGVVVQLYADGTAYGAPVTLTADGHWRTTWTDLNVNSAGEEITYTVAELHYLDAQGNKVELTEEYYTEGTPAKDELTGITTITNTHQVQKTSVEVKKNWVDAEDQDRIRPLSVTVELYQNGQPTGKTAVLNAANGWTAKFENLDVHHGIGVDNVYTIVEIGHTDKNDEGEEVYTEGVPEDYEVSYNGTTVINTHKVEKVSIPVSKVWDDADDQDGKRPVSITVQLYADGVAVDGKTLTLNAAGNWQGSFDGLDKNQNGTAIVYTVGEVGHTDLDADGKEVYTATVPEGYEVSVDGTTITNTHVPETTSVSVRKVWDDSDNRDGVRPTSIKLHLLADGVHTERTVTLSADNADTNGDWVYEWTDLPKYAEAKVINYTVYEEITEQMTKDGYSASYTRDTDGTVIVTNTRDTLTTTYTVQKVWVDANNQDNLRPYGIVVELYANGNPTGNRRTLSADEGWRVTWSNLNLNEDGEKIVYSAVEVGYYATEAILNTQVMTSGIVPGYTVSDPSTDPVTGIGMITNTHVPATTSITVKKAWNDANDQDGIRPESVIVELYQNGQPTGKIAVLEADKGWTAVFADLPVHHGIGVDNVYTVVEVISEEDADGNTTYKVGAPEGYTANIGSSDNNYTVTNTHEVDKVSIPVMKVWDDANDQDGKRPASVTVTVEKLVGEDWVSALDVNGNSVSALTLNAANNWQGSFNNLPKNSGGAKIKYRVVEAAVPYYNLDADGEAQELIVEFADGRITLTNAHETEKTSIKATKVWNDNNNQDGQRPEEITLHLLANGEHTGKTATLSADANGNWVYEWTKLPKYEEGKEINYTVYEETVGNGYTGSIERNGNEVTITNTRAIEKTSFAVQKVWNDANNQDNVRYSGVVVGLYAGRAEVGTATLTAASHWVHTWTGLDKNADGEAITYTVKELYYLDAEGNRVELDEAHYTEGEPVLNATSGITTITNTHEVQLTKVEVTKVWSDGENQDGIRPYAVRVELYRNGQPTGQTLELKDNNQKVVFENLHVHHGIGVDNVYTVVETGYLMTEGGEWRDGDAPGYAAKVTGDAADGYTVTNSHTPEIISVPVAKNWDDNNDQDGIRPDSIVVQLYANDKAVEGKTLTLTAEDNWKGSFDGLDKFADGEEIVYTAKEVGDISGYEVSYNGTNVTNTHTPETANLNVQKVWDDENNQDGKRPYAVIITLYANGQPAEEVLSDYPDLVYQKSLTLYADDNWQGAWTGMPVYHNGQRISYSVVETGYIQKKGENPKSGLPAGYTVAHTYGVNDEGEPLATVTNSYTPELTDLNVQKVWNDDDNRAGKRPGSVTVTLTKQVGDDWVVVKDANGDDMTAQLNPANEWDYTFIGMPKYANGVEIVYGVKETALDGSLGYKDAEYSYDRTTRIATITNTREDEKVDVVVKKDWDDNDNQDGKRPGSVTVTLYANGIATSETRTLTGDNWTATFENLYKHYKGKEVVYTVVETAVEGYTAEYTVTSDSAGNLTILVENIHVPEVISIPVTKRWDDADNQDGIRPDSITVELHRNGQPTGMKATLSVDNNWTDTTTFVELDKFANGQEIIYTVVEEAVEGYNVTDGEAQSVTAGVVNGAALITNVHEPEKTEVTVVKQWNDSNDQDGKRPDSIKVHLLADGVHTTKTVELTEAMGWTWTWENLDKYADGKEIVYTVYEEISAAGAQSTVSREISDYIPSYERDPENHNRITITNSYIPETITLTVLKAWDDGADRDGLRPDSIEVELYADDVFTGKKLVLDEANGWTGAWTDMTKYRDHGTEIVYSVKEVELPDGYEVKIVRDEEVANGMFIVTNFHEPATTGVGVHKVWDDEDDNDGKRPDGIIVQLYANGSAVEGARVELNVMNNWSHVWHSTEGHPLYVFDKGEEVSYYVDEVGYVIDGTEYENLPEGYGKTLSTKDYTTSITNTRETEKLNISVEKVWEDSDNNDGIRPAAVTMTLYRNGEVYETVDLSAENGWAHTWTQLYKYVAGEEAEYTVKETEIAGYTASYVSSERADGGVHWTVTNTHEIETVDMAVSKVWEDSDDKEGYRPSSVTVQLYKNGQAYGPVITLTKADGWKYPVTLPVYENGVKINWTISEINIPKYYSATYDHKTLTVTNTIQSKEIPKTGDDANLLFWMGMMLLSGAGAVALIYDRKRKFSKT